jgi:hypothetical protein
MYGLKMLSQRATPVFMALIEGLDKTGDARCVDLTNGAFMPVHVDRMYEVGPVANGMPPSVTYAIHHSYVQNGDLVPDPDMMFWHICINGKNHVIPMTFQQGGRYVEAVEICGSELRVARRQQREITEFANMWMENIRQQQGHGDIRKLRAGIAKADGADAVALIQSLGIDLSSVGG